MHSPRRKRINYAYSYLGDTTKRVGVECAPKRSIYGHTESFRILSSRKSLSPSNADLIAVDDLTLIRLNPLAKRAVYTTVSRGKQFSGPVPIRGRIYKALLVMEPKWARDHVFIIIFTISHIAILQ